VKKTPEARHLQVTAFGVSFTAQGNDNEGDPGDPPTSKSKVFGVSFVVVLSRLWPLPFQDPKSPAFLAAFTPSETTGL